MNKMQKHVLEFHKEFNLGIGSGAEFKPQAPSGFDNRMLRKRLIKEEYRELCSALVRNDMVGIIDGSCDLIYVVLGTMVEAGIDIEPFFDEVHRSNMTKKGGTIREDGKLIKPDTYEAPKIAEMLKDGIGIATEDTWSGK